MPVTARPVRGLTLLNEAHAGTVHTFTYRATPGHTLPAERHYRASDGWQVCGVTLGRTGDVLQVRVTVAPEGGR